MWGGHMTKQRKNRPCKTSREKIMNKGADSSCRATPVTGKKRPSIPWGGWSTDGYSQIGQPN